MSYDLFPRENKKFELFPEINDLEIKVSILISGGNKVEAKLFSKINFPAQGVVCGHKICRNGGLTSSQVISLISNMKGVKR